MVLRGVEGLRLPRGVEHLRRIGRVLRRIVGELLPVVSG